MIKTLSSVVGMFVTPWWEGVPTKLIRKTTLIAASENHLPVHTLTFETPKDGVFAGPSKPHNEMRLDLGDVVKMCIPNYKPKSYSISRLAEDEFDVTLKVYPNGRASGYLDSLKVGDTIGSFGKSKGCVRNAGSYVGIVSFGVGITEALPVGRAELEKGDARKVVLLWASRTMADTFWGTEIDALLKEYGDKFEVVYILSRETKEGCLHGRIDADVLKKVFQPSEEDTARFISVGTKEMMSMTSGLFAEIGYPLPEHALLPKA